MPFLLELNTVEEAAGLCRELGLSFVELNANFPACQVDALDPMALRLLAKRYGIYFTLHIEEECDPFTFSERVRRAWRESVRSAILLAKAAGLPVVNMHFPMGVYITLPEEKTYLYEKYGTEFREAVETFIRMAEEEIGDSGVLLCIENTSGWAAWQRAAIDRLLRSPVFALTLDIGHCHGAGNVDEDFFLARKDRLRHMHGHDALGKRNHLPLGDGEIDLAGRFALAERCGARVVLEIKTVAALRESVRRLPEIWPRNAK